MKRYYSPKTLTGRTYPTRHCIFCGSEISKFSEKTGLQYWKSKYVRLISCKGETCVSLAHASMSSKSKSKNQTVVFKMPDTAQNRFLYGRS